MHLSASDSGSSYADEHAGGGVPQVRALRVRVPQPRVAVPVHEFGREPAVRRVDARVGGRARAGTGPGARRRPSPTRGHRTARRRRAPAEAHPRRGTRGRLRRPTAPVRPGGSGTGSRGDPTPRSAPCDAEVVRHQVHVIHDSRDLRHLGVREEVVEGAGGQRQEQTRAAGRRRAVERAPELGHERGEVLLVLRPMHVAVAGQTRVLPVHVEAVEVVPADKGHRAGDEAGAALRGQGGVRKAPGPGPAADGDEDLQLRVRLAQRCECGQVLLVERTAFDDLAVAAGSANA